MHILIRRVMRKDTKLSRKFSAKKVKKRVKIKERIFHQSCLDWLEMNFNQENLHAKFQAKMGLGHSLKILSSFSKSQTILGAKNFFCLKWILKHLKSHF